MVAEFVRKALAAAGVECVEREPGLLRVYPHPALTELLGGEPWIELACDEGLLHEHQAALLCIPGSYPLDRILALVQEMPRAFRFAASPDFPTEPPERAPRVENAAGSLHLNGPTVRTAWRMLVRVRLQTDETLEQLVWVATDQRGRERPELLAGWESNNRALHPTVEPPPPHVPPALEKQAAAAAVRWGQEYARAAPPHQQQERERLERFYRATLEELPTLLPAGPARRLAEARAQVQAFGELLRASLPGEGSGLQWKKGELRAHGWWPFRRPGVLPELPPDDRLRLHRLLPHLPTAFSLEDLGRSLEAEAAPRLQRLAERLAGDPESAALMQQAEQRLREEHEARLADLERKLQLRILVTPRLLEELHYQAAEFALRVEGGPTLRACWDPVAEAWEPVACPTCGEPASQLWLCGNRTLGCDHCASRCSGCERVEPRTAPLRPCARCESPACDACGQECAECGSWNCGRHAFYCASCSKTRCSACGAACGLCSGAACAEHPEICGVCRKVLCAEHQARCRVCDAVVCPDDRAPCPICRGDCCAPHQAECSLCLQRYCARCVSGGRCETCRAPQPAGEATVAALRAQVAALLPGLDVPRLGGWTLARNARCRVITARAWPWGYRFVLDEETGALLEHSRFLRPVSWGD